MKKSALFAAICVPAFLAAAPLAAKTLVYCSEGSPENFYPGVNTTGTSFDATEQVYDNIVDFERGGTKVVPDLAEKCCVDHINAAAVAALSMIEQSSASNEKATADE